MVNSVELMQLCRLCLVKDQVNIPIFEDKGDAHQIFLKISACLPVKVSREDNLPKKICNDCSYKLDLFYQFWNTSVNSEKQLLAWLNEISLNQDTLTDNTMQKSEVSAPGLVLKQEAVELESDPQTDSNNMVSNEAQDYLLQQQQLPYQPPAFPYSGEGKFPGPEIPAGSSVPNTVTTNNTEEAPLSQKRKRKATATVTQPDSEEDDDDDDDGMDAVETKVAKTEETSDDDRDDEGIEDQESTSFAGMPSTSTDNEQPGPSGMGKAVTEAPHVIVKRECENSDDSTYEDSKPNNCKSPSKKKQIRRRRVWPCSKCNEQFSTSKILRQHRKIHQKEKYDNPQYSYNFDASKDIYNCITCDVECATEEEMQKHVLTHKDHYTCDTCGLFFDDPYKYATHVHVHGNDRKFKCPLCESYQSASRTCLQTHINTFHLHRFIYRCSTCGKGFNDYIQSKEHNNIHKGLKPFECIVCGKSFPFSSYLHTHQFRNHRVSIEGVLGTNQCYICLRRYANARTLQKHIKKHELDEKKASSDKKHLCDICGKEFTKKDKLKIHYRIHTGDKPYSCSYCPKSFTKRDYLVMHERVHSGEKPYSCEYCGKCFNQGAPLRVHIRGHTGERPYVCHICKNGFTSRGALNLHFKNCSGINQSYK